jgi:hypothetical protein
MAIDASIALGLKPVQIENPLNNMVKFSNIQNDMASMALHRQKYAQDERLQQEDRDFKSALAAIPNLNTPEGKEAARHAHFIHGRGKDWDAMMASEATTAKTRDDIKKSRYDLSVRKRRDMISNTSDENVIANYQDTMLDPDATPQEKADATRGKDFLLSLNPDQRKDHLRQLDATVAERQPHLNSTHAGGKTVFTSTDKFSGKTIQVGEVADTLTPEQAMYAPTDLEAKQARYKFLAKQTADQDALIARTSGLGLPGTVEMLTEQQKSRTAEQDVLRGEIGVLQKQGQSAKNTTIAPLQLLNELDLLVKNGQGNSQRAKDVRGLIEKEKHIAETEAYTPEGLNLAAELVRNGVVPPRGGKGAINAAAAAGVTAKDYVSGKANIAGLTQVTKTESQTGAFENTFVKNAEATLQMGRRIGKSGVPIIDEYLANPAARASGKNPELAAYDVFIKGTLNEYAKIVSGSLGNTAVAQAEIKKMEKLLNSAQTTEQLENAVNAMITETRNRRWGFKAQKAEILGQPAPAAPVNKFNLETKEVMVNGKKIKAVKGEDGKWYPK